MQSLKRNTTLSELRSPRVFPASSTRAFSSVNDPAQNFLSGSNASYIDATFQQWKANPSSVHSSWDSYFRSGQFTAPPTLMPAGYVPSSAPASSPFLSSSSSSSATTASSSSDPASFTASQERVVMDNMRVLQLIRAFQVRGHFLANLDPLGLMAPRMHHKELELSHYGFSDEDLSRTFNLGFMPGFQGFVEKGRPTVTLKQIYQRLKETYCGNIGYEYMHIPSVEKCNWIRNKIETYEQRVFSKEEQLTVLDRLTWSDHFERFLAMKYSTAKRFGLEGGETACAALVAMTRKASDLGVESVVMGMPHRGRLNVLGTVIRKPLEIIYAEFAGNPNMFVPKEDDSNYCLGTGDVKYHLGASNTRTLKNGKQLKLSLAPNPSHLEAVNPVVMGKTRAKQFYSNDADRSKNMSILMHGDAAFAGQGIVYECMSFSDLPDYSVGGTIHLVVNNQVGFTTDADRARSGPYCTDVAKSNGVPIFHVNGDDPEAVQHVAELAAEWRQTFKKDCVIDLVCYRKHGHNEIDEPSFTQPLMYQKVGTMKSVLELYQQKLIAQGRFTKEEVEALSKKVFDEMAAKFEVAKGFKNKPKDWLEGDWEGIKSMNTFSPVQSTGVEKKTLKKVGDAICRYPSTLNIHKRLKTVYDKKAETVGAGDGIDWATAEALAFGSLLLEGKHVRLSGQDVERGTFSHRHAVIHDQKTNETYAPLKNISPKQATFSVSNSNLSEFGVLGFELGYSLERPDALVLWEAQFGDFANGAQVILDNFVSSMEHKWLRQSGLTILLPHGYEGQGPEHSSARMERFLQMVCDDPNHIPDESKSLQIQHSNWQIVNCSTPANYFHVLRRQLCREFRKPLVVFNPKSLLRHPNAKSSMSEMETDTFFRKVIPDDGSEIHADASKIKKVLFCSGKVYYELAARRSELKLKNIAIARVEQIAPFPFDLVSKEVARFPNAEVLWLQEEPMNMGAWTYVCPRIETAARKHRGPNFRPKYVGRIPAASPATGSPYVHEKEQAEFINAALHV